MVFDFVVIVVIIFEVEKVEFVSISVFVVVLR